MSGLSEADVASLNEAHASWILWRERGTWESYIAPAVEAIVARAVNEALTEAADAVRSEGSRRVLSGVAASHLAAYANAARIVRAQAT